MILRKVTSVIMLCALLVGGSMSAGHAVNWASKKDPLRVSGYGSVGWGYGTWKVSSAGDGTRSRLKAELNYKNADNHKVFAKLVTWVNAGTCFGTDYMSCSAKYYHYSERDTGHSNKAGKWVTKK